ncbi:hypothetical protein [Actinoplanes philippinensis]|uniref:hypothetical protein n=1 Tax=Actinoplanes philippinensis TaxID=35752 RepID=UPI0033E8355D
MVAEAGRHRRPASPMGRAVLVAVCWLTPTSLLVRAGLATAISQAAWGTALILGYLNSRGR